MSDHKPLLPFIIHSRRLHQTATRALPIPRRLQIHMQRKQADAAVVALAPLCRLIVRAAPQTNKPFIPLLKIFSAHNPILKVLTTKVKMV